MCYAGGWPPDPVRCWIHMRKKVANSSMTEKIPGKFQQHEPVIMCRVYPARYF